MPPHHDERSTRLCESVSPSLKPCAEAPAVTSRYVFLAGLYIKLPHGLDKGEVHVLCRSTKAAGEGQGRPWP